MPFHLIAYYESVDPGGAFNDLTAVNDIILSTSGDDQRIAAGFDHLWGAAILVNDASAAQARVTSPSLRGRVDKYYEKIRVGTVMGNPPEANLHPYSPIKLVPNEDLNVQVLSDPAAPAVHQAIVFLGSGPAEPVQGEILTVRATTTIALAAGAWVNGVMTFSQDLPVGRYALVGCRARGANLVAVRFVFRDQTHRPGTLAISGVGYQDVPYSRYGELGVWGEFESVAPPSVDAFGITDTSQTLLLDLIRVQ